MYEVEERSGTPHQKNYRKHERGSVTVLLIPWLNLRFSISDHGYTVTHLDDQDEVVAEGPRALTVDERTLPDWLMIPDEELTGSPIEDGDPIPKFIRNPDAHAFEEAVDTLHQERTHIVSENDVPGYCQFCQCDECLAIRYPFGTE